MTKPDRLHMLQMALSQPHVVRMASQRRFPIRQSDAGYMVHCLLGELFGSHAITPFAIRGEAGRVLRVLGYSPHDAAHLQRQAEIAAEPANFQACDWRAFASKPMPSSWRAGERLGFESRICPVKRMSSDGRHHRRGAEVDAFLARAWQLDPEEPLSREVVYIEWLREELARRGGACLVDASVVRYRRTRLLRRTQGPDRSSRLLERPDVLVRGSLKIEGASDFSSLLARGLGRHRSFGFGMLLLRQGS